MIYTVTFRAIKKRKSAIEAATKQDAIDQAEKMAKSGDFDMFEYSPEFDRIEVLQVENSG